jgi:hypothetical protein
VVRPRFELSTSNIHDTQFAHTTTTTTTTMLGWLIEMGYGLDGWRSVPGRSKKRFCLPQHPHRF